MAETPTYTQRAAPYAIVSLTLVAGFALSYFFFTVTKEAEDQRVRFEFERRATNLPAALQEGLNRRLQNLAPLAQASRSGFKAAAARMMGEDNALTALALALRVDSSYPIAIIEPAQGYELLAGLDLASDPSTVKAFEAARRTGAAYATGKNSLPPAASGVYVIVPSAGEPRQPGKAAPAAFALAAFDIDAMAAESFRGMDLAGIEVRLFDMQESSLPAEQRVLHESRDGAISAASPVQRLRDIVAGPHLARGVTFANRLWSVVISPTPEYLAQLGEGGKAGSLLAGGIVVSILAAGYLFRLLTHTAQVEREVARRTAAITSINQSLQEEILRRKAAEEKIRQQDMEISHAMRLAALGEMAAGISHEVNQPLTAIMNYAENSLMMLERGEGDTRPVRENLREIVNQIRRAKSVNTNFRNFARNDAGLDTPVDLGALAASAVELLHFQIRGKQIEIIIDAHPLLPAVMGDPLRLEQVFINLLLNAIQSIPEGAAGTIKITTRPGQDGHAQVEIGDNGRGMDQQTVDQLFKPFFSTKSSGEGTGLGLAISKRIVTAHGGTITPRSEPGKGSTFTITLPAAEGGGRADG